MQKPSQRGAARFLACAGLIVILSAVLAVSGMVLRGIAELRARVQDIEARGQEREARLESEVEGISERLGDFSGGMRSEIAAARRGSRGEMSRLGNSLSSSISAVQGKLDQMTSQLSRASPETVAAARPAEKPPENPAPEVAPVESEASNQDLRILRQLHEGKALFETAKYAQAQKRFHAVLVVQPDNTDARLYYAASLYRANPADASAYPTIEKNLRTVLSSDGENPLALETFAMVAVERQKWPDAIDYLRRLITVRPENVSFLKTAGYCVLKAGDVESARDYFQSASNHAPVDVEALSLLGDCESNLGNAEKAEDSWKSALSAIDPRAAGSSRVEATLREKLARSTYDRGAYEESLAFAHEGDRQSESALLRAYEGLSLVGLGRTNQGVELLREVASSTDQQAASLAEKGLKESGQ